MKLKFFKTHIAVPTPQFKTEQSACFDLSFSSAGKTEVKGYNSYNSPIVRPINHNRFFISPKERFMVPTGLIIDIPEGHSVRIHPRSGNSLKQGLTLVNSEGVIDSDYVEELFILVTNSSDNGYFIHEGDRIAQGELIKSLSYEIEVTYEKPVQKTDRIGGMGSTGT